MATTTRRDSDVEDWLDSLDPAAVPVRDATHMRRIADARKQLAAADRNLRHEVEVARAAGDTWTMIGLALGVTRQAAFQRFGKNSEACPT